MDKSEIWLLAVLSGFLTTLGQKYGVLAILVFTAIIFDIGTGMLKAHVTKTVNSTIGTHGFWKKLSLLFGFAFGIFLDYLEHYIIFYSEKQLSLHIPYTIPIGLVVGVYIIINESISICENLFLSGCKMPNFLVQALQVSQKSIDNKKNISGKS